MKLTPSRTLLLALATSVASALGCAHRKSPPPTTKPLGPPVIDSRRGGGSFPLETKTPIRGAADLIGALDAGYLKRMTPGGGARTASAATLTVGSGSAHLRELAIDVSKWQVRPDYKPSELAPDAKVEGTLEVDHLVYSAEPLKYEHGSFSVRLEADNAQLQIVRDKNDVRGLVLAGAKRGSFHLYAPLEEFQAATFGATKKGAGQGGVGADEITGELTSANPRELKGVLHIRGSWLLLPMILTITGKISVDDQMFANFSEMSCDGDGPAGIIVAPFVDRAMKKIDGRRSPLMVFRDGKTHATDFQVHVGDNIDLKIAFGQ